MGIWIHSQRQAFKGKGKLTISKEKIDLLKQIGMIFGDVHMTEWMNMYNLAKAYYEHHGNLEIVKKFKTKNGYEYDENGVKLGIWIHSQRKAFKGKGKSTINKEKIDLLKQIGMNFGDVYITKWMNMYNLAKTYYEYYGNLKIPYSFKTINGYEYDETGIKLGVWIRSQRQLYRGEAGNMTEEKIKKLENIGMIWYDRVTLYEKSLKEKITDLNKLKKKIEIANRLKSLLNQLDENTIPTREKINQQFLEDFDKPSRRK